MDKIELIRQAINARKSAYAPYSSYQVGAALYTKDGTIYTGCNVENASYGATLCAERCAVAKAVSDGKKEFLAIAIVGGEEGKAWGYAYPCGVCRQVLREFSCPNHFTVIVAKSPEEYQEYTLEELLPNSFGPDFKNN